METGKEVFEYSNAHGEHSITCLAFDDQEKRLITGGRDGLCKIWNYNNGHCLRVLIKENNLETLDVEYVKINTNNRFFVSVGWDRSINIYEDLNNDYKFYVSPMKKWEDDEVSV